MSFRREIDLLLHADELQYTCNIELTQRQHNSSRWIPAGIEKLAATNGERPVSMFYTK